MIGTFGLGGGKVRPNLPLAHTQHYTGRRPYHHSQGEPNGQEEVSEGSQEISIKEEATGEEVWREEGVENEAASKDGTQEVQEKVGQSIEGGSEKEASEKEEGGCQEEACENGKAQAEDRRKEKNGNKA